MPTPHAAPPSAQQQGPATIYRVYARKARPMVIADKEAPSAAVHDICRAEAAPAGSWVSQRAARPPHRRRTRPSSNPKPVAISPELPARRSAATPPTSHWRQPQMRPCATNTARQWQARGGTRSARPTRNRAQDAPRAGKRNRRAAIPAPPTHTARIITPRKTRPQLRTKFAPRAGNHATDKTAPAPGPAALAPRLKLIAV